MRYLIISAVDDRYITFAVTDISGDDYCLEALAVAIKMPAGCIKPLEHFFFEVT